MIFLSQLVLSRTALNQRFYFVSLKLSSKKLRTGLYGSYNNNNNKDFIYRGGHVTAEKLTNLWPSKIELTSMMRTV